MNEQTYLQQVKALQAARWPKGTTREPIYPHGEKPVTEYLSAWARLNPTKVAIQFYGYELTYAQLDEMSTRFANVLRGLGVGQGDGVAVFMPNCPQFHIAFLGILKCGAVHMPVSPLSKEMELRHQLGDSQPKVALCYDALLPTMRPVCQELGIEHIITTSYTDVRPRAITAVLPDLFEIPKTPLADGIIDFFEAIDNASKEVLDYIPALDDLAAINYTSGTTGMPKGVMHTHRNMIGTMASYYPVTFGEVGPEGTDLVMLSFLPEFWIAGEDTGLLLPLYSGATLVLMARWDTKAFMELVHHHKVNMTIMLIDSVDEILNHPHLHQFDLTSLTTVPCISFIKKLNRDYRQRWRELTGTTLFEVAYGMTETHTCDTFTRGFQVDDMDLSFDPAFLGLPVPGTEIKICDFVTGELMPLGVEGEIQIRTPTLLKGYWNKPDLNKNLFEEGGWYRTGDLGMITEEGFFRYLGRRKEMLKVNGMSVFPTEVESMLGQHPAIASCGVVGRPDERKGQVPVAFVTLKPGFDETQESLQAWCVNAMAIFKVPEIRIQERLPMTATGKIRKVDLEKSL
ncbi:AMP-binding protein [Shewanella loihica]|uniref:AMP-dependent synthetase and ligase n=1 Tax=Shewanella loihica (strain ATCC BAA-1088 / PV-4) TaxID=323850 RepID=A3QGY4_SHELP|nr:AMP-binding protein [Shewanella loihica]ABO24732.1 AMP-dependent synthetase and ligase [Shewanella loihica PV-4]